jgi:hypothetical protein
MLEVNFQTVYVREKNPLMSKRYSVLLPYGADTIGKKYLLYSVKKSEKINSRENKNLG